MGQIEELSVPTSNSTSDFVVTPYVEEITQRALDYIRAGYPVHFSGPAGTGKTSLAMHVAAQLGREIILMHGDDEFGTSDLVGAQTGYRSTKVIDNYIHSVLKQEETVSKQWVDNRLTSACKHGLTLIYDEFNRSRPEANNILLSVLEERLLGIPSVQFGDGYLQVHPGFTAIFTSNPEEYAGVHKAQDALLDRMVTIKLDRHDVETEIAITQSKSGLPYEDCRAIVEMIREFRKIGVNNARPTIRACIMLARVVALRGTRVAAADPNFRKMCHDVMNVDCVKVTHDSEALGSGRLDTIIDACCPQTPGMHLVASALPEVKARAPKHKRRA